MLPKWGASRKQAMVKKVRFGEDHWFGPSILAIQYWEIYIIIN
jgi:hypothetical protein